MTRITFAQFPIAALLFFVLIAGNPSPVRGETSATSVLQNAETTDSLSGLTSEVKSALVEAEKLTATTSDSEVGATSLELLKQAAEQLKVRETVTSETQEHEQAVREAPAQLEQVQAALKLDDAQTTTAELPSTASLEMVEQQLATAQAERKSLRDQLEQVNQQQQRRTTRMEAIPQETVDARQRLAEARIATQSAPGDEDAMVTRARQLLARARVMAAQARITSLQKEQARYEAREQLLPAARKLLTERVAASDDAIAALEESVARLRRSEAAATAQQLKHSLKETQTSHPLVRSVAGENTSITSLMNLGKLVEAQNEIQDRLRITQEQVARTSGTFTSLRSKFESVGYSDALGIILRQHRRDLPNSRSQRVGLEALDSRIADVNLKVLETQDMVSELANPDAMAKDLVAKEGLDPATTQTRSIRNEVSQLLQARRDYLVKVSEAYDKLFQSLVELNAAEDDQVRVTSEFKAFIDERILWLPSTDRISVNALESAGSAFVALVRPSQLKAYASAVAGQARQHIVAFTLGALLLLFIILAHKQWRIHLQSAMQSASKHRLGAFAPLVRSLFFAALYVSPLPALMVMLGLPVAHVLQVPVEVSSLGEGLIRGGSALLVFLWVKVILKRGGIAEVFFVWQENALRRLRKAFSLLGWVYVPSVVLIRTWENLGTDIAMEGARILLVVALLVVFAAVCRLLWPPRSVLMGAEVYKSSTWLYKFRYVLFLVMAGGPLVLASGALLGYVYTALELTLRLNMSVWFGILVLLLSETAFFWILVKRRRLAIDEARKRRELAKAQQTGDGESADVPALPAEPSLDIAAISQQAGRLLRVFLLGLFLLGLWGIWAGVLPALNYLDSRPLWSVSRTVSEADPSTGAISSVDKIVPVTLANLFLALLVLMAMGIALRNIPGLLDIGIYQRFAVQKGERYAFNTLIQYVLIIFGCVTVLYLLGLQWKQIQWLLAGVSVGLGFGLQEIFANFVSGVILLFERPVRVGDIVTVGDQSGRVTQIRIRATTVMNWDHKTLIIPNKELITKSVLNWTLAGTQTRLVIFISVAHNSDFDLARELILKVARNSQYTLRDPGPAAAIERLDVTGVDFMLLAHLPSTDNAMDAKHEIISGIEREFAAAGIIMAVPKMDVKIEQVPGTPA